MQFQRFFSSYIVASKRTPIGTFLGKMSKLKAVELSSLTIQECLKSISLSPEQIDEVILGNVLQAGIGQSPAKQAALGAGLPVNVSATTINKVCASGLKSIVYATMGINAGINSCVVAGGFESMSNSPFYINNHRKGFSFGNEIMVDAISHDGLQDAYNKIAMGLCAEKTVKDFGFNRQIQDDYCITSYERSLESQRLGRFQEQIVPIQISEKEIISEDEEPKKFMKEKIPLIRSVFAKDGTITAANSSKINDGACSLILMSEQKVKQNNLKPLARVISFADGECSPIDFCIAPSISVKLALERAGLNIRDISYFELNEAFSVTALANMKLLDLDIDKVNIYGGAVSLGHPIGMSGARIVQNLIQVLKDKKAKYGLAGICNGGGGSTSIIIENLQ